MNNDASHDEVLEQEEIRAQTLVAWLIAGGALAVAFFSGMLIGHFI